MNVNSDVRHLSFFGEHGNRIQPTHRFYKSNGPAVIMRPKKILATIIALALLLAGIVPLRLRRDQQVGPSVTETSRLIGGPAFEVQVEMPELARNLTNRWTRPAGACFAS
jgi:hypothetical protein